jgi:hypothetical protein
MSRRKKDSAETFELEIMPPELVRLDFEKLDRHKEGTRGAKVRSDVLLGFARPELRIFTARMGLKIRVPGQFQVELMYEAGFRVSGEGGPQELEHFLRECGAWVAPTVLFPYVRETLTTVMQKAGFPPSVAPLLSSRSMFSPDEIQFPPPPPEAGPTPPKRRKTKSAP